MEVQIETANAEIVIVGELPEVSCDHILITQVFQNLLTNSIKFAREAKPLIEISCSKKDDCYILRVKDNGIGIDEKNTSKIFKPFKQLNPQTEFAGSGIGLSTCQKIIERHDEKIWVESEGLGCGTSFLFTLSCESL